MGKRIQFMDILRTLAVLLVMWGHFIMVGTFATSIPGIIANNNLPILNQNKQGLWKFEGWLVNYFHTQTAIIGVLLFFLITGYLISQMQERYSPINFLINRFFRIFPTLGFCIIINGIFVYLTQGISFKFISYLASITLIYNFILVPPIMGVLWTLIIEVIFYLLASFIKKFDIYKLIAMYAFILLTIILCSKYKNNNILFNFAYNMKYIAFILVGTSIQLAENVEKMFNRILLISSSAIYAFSIFKLYYFLFNDKTTYPNIGSHVITLTIFLTFYLIQNKTNIFERLPKAVYYGADLVYPMYLIHPVFGLGIMYILASKGINNYLIICGGVVLSIIISTIVHVVIEKPSIKFGKKIIKSFTRFEGTVKNLSQN